MESRKKRCRHCRCLFVAARNPQQKFCSRRLCQNVRKAIWRREKHEHDPDYCANRNQACKRWRRKNPDYWKPYREAHPGYTERNKSKQRQRKQALCRRSRTPDGGTAPQFANSDALTPKNPVKAGTYQLIPFPGEGFANSDALIVKISIIPESYKQIGGVCKHTTL